MCNIRIFIFILIKNKGTKSNDKSNVKYHRKYSVRGTNL